MIAPSSAPAAWKLIGFAATAALIGLAATPLLDNIAQAAEIPIAFAGFGFTDSSGEPADQRKIHAERLGRFKADVEAGLETSGKYRVVLLSCQTETCGASDSEAAELADEAKKAGADLLLIGGIQKMSSLILWMKADVVDLKTNKTVLDKLLTFRGDNDEAWSRASEFLLRELREMRE